MYKKNYLIHFLMLVMVLIGFIACESDPVNPDPQTLTYEEVIPGENVFAAIGEPETMEITNSTDKRSYNKQSEGVTEEGSIPPKLRAIQTSLDSLDWEVKVSTVDTIRTYTVTGTDTTYTDEIVYGEPYDDVVNSPFVIKLADGPDDTFMWGTSQGIAIEKNVLDTLSILWVRIDNVKFGESPKVKSDLKVYFEDKGYDSEGNLVFGKRLITPGEWIPLKTENSIMHETAYFYGPNNLPDEAVTVANLQILMHTEMLGLHTFKFSVGLSDGTMLTQDEAKVKSLPTQRFRYWYHFTDRYNL